MLVFDRIILYNKREYYIYPKEYFMYRIGVDLGGTNIAAGIVDKDYNIISKDSVPTKAERTAEEIIADMAGLCKKLCADAGIALSDIESIGVASPGIVDNDSGMVLYANNLPFRKLPLAKMLRELTGIENIKMANDANAAALGEAVAGAAKGTKHSVMVTLGTGVGGGIIIDGKVFPGGNGAGAELGHVVIEHGGVPCSCGRRGCWESYSSATALIRMTKEAIEKANAEGRYTSMASVERISGRTACDAMRAGDEVAKEVYDKYLAYLANGIASIVNVFQPEIISLGGGISNEGQSLIDDLVPLVRKEQYGDGIVKTADIKIAKLKNDAGIIGAAAL